MRASSLFSLLRVLYHQHQLFIVIERENIPCVLDGVLFIEILATINLYYQVNNIPSKIRIEIVHPAITLFLYSLSNSTDLIENFYQTLYKTCQC